VNPSELIRKKRGGGELTRGELEFLVSGFVDNRIPDYQMSAFLMAVYFRGMTFPETTALTELMLATGKTADLASVPGIKVDKHSTGGVGDKVSIILAPMVAA
jgi:thymidine phosphorylase